MTRRGDEHGCDALDVAVLWPCHAQVGIIPVPPDVAPRRRQGKLPDADEEGG